MQNGWTETEREIWRTVFTKALDGNLSCCTAGALATQAVTDHLTARALEAR